MVHEAVVEQEIQEVKNHEEAFVASQENLVVHHGGNLGDAFRGNRGERLEVASQEEPLEASQEVPLELAYQEGTAYLSFKIQEYNREPQKIHGRNLLQASYLKAPSNFPRAL